MKAFTSYLARSFSHNTLPKRFAKSFTLALALATFASPVHAGFFDDLQQGDLSKLAEVAQTGKVDSSSLIKELVDEQCKKELNNRQEWKLISMFMSKEKKQAWEEKVCGCVTEETVNSASTSDVAKIVNPSTRSKTLVKVTSKAVKSCVARFGNEF